MIEVYDMANFTVPMKQTITNYCSYETNSNDLNPIINYLLCNTDHRGELVNVYLKFLGKMKVVSLMDLLSIRRRDLLEAGRTDRALVVSELKLN